LGGVGHGSECGTRQASKAGHEEGLGMRLRKWCNNWISQPRTHSQCTL